MNNSIAVTYKRNENADINGTSLQGHITASYADLVALFGEPAESDGYKVSGEWTIESSAGDVFTIYDYKSTNLYDRSSPSVEAFRAQRSAEFNIGGRERGAANEFIQRLNELLREYKNRKAIAGIQAVVKAVEASKNV